MTRDFSTKSPGALRRGFHRLYRHFTSRAPALADAAHTTGELWVDGRPIYRKLVDFGALPADNILKEVAHGIDSIGLVIDMGLIGTDGEGYFHTAPNHSVFWYVDDTNVGVHPPSAAGLEGNTAVVSIDYVLPA